MAAWYQNRPTQTPSTVRPQNPTGFPIPPHVLNRGPRYTSITTFWAGCLDPESIRSWWFQTSTRVVRGAGASGVPPSTPQLSPPERGRTKNTRAGGKKQKIETLPSVPSRPIPTVKGHRDALGRSAVGMTDQRDLIISVGIPGRPASCCSLAAERRPVPRLRKAKILGAGAAGPESKPDHWVACIYPEAVLGACLLPRGYVRISNSGWSSPIYTPGRQHWGGCCFPEAMSELAIWLVVAVVAPAATAAVKHAPDLDMVCGGGGGGDSGDNDNGDDDDDDDYK
ncbi:hypothetical protein F4809DRAFT_647066 [Biscogniauxia mediterranea]|nr:hypothetical protein F4809DRAFT_647066 [Biscogniauxia mediterranea]